ncbi:MAG: hypothetical protein EOM64_07755 [Erysipelotrichia bacterium]|nr:hypothetical protein [Erysipelotrichia bacterium]
MYKSNPINSFTKKLSSIGKKEQFLNEESSDRITYVIASDYGRQIKSWQTKKMEKCSSEFQ